MDERRSIIKINFQISIYSIHNHSEGLTTIHKI